MAPEMSHISDSDWFNMETAVTEQRGLHPICAACCSAAAALCKYRGRCHRPPHASLLPLTAASYWLWCGGWVASLHLPNYMAVSAKLAGSTLSK